ncbi:MAG: hypothetical protein R3F40_07780 [Candidatus Competibacteraceae bacterium]
MLAVERRWARTNPRPRDCVSRRDHPNPDMSETERWAEYHAAREVRQRHKRAATQARRDAQATEREASVRRTGANGMLCGGRCHRAEDGPN